MAAPPTVSRVLRARETPEAERTERDREVIAWADGLLARDRRRLRNKKIKLFAQTHYGQLLEKACGPGAAADFIDKQTERNEKLRAEQRAAGR